MSPPEIDKADLQVLGGFVAADPPIWHRRATIGRPCKQPCKACEYLKQRAEALDVVIKLQQQWDEYEVRGFIGD